MTGSPVTQAVPDYAAILKRMRACQLHGNGQCQAEPARLLKNLVLMARTSGGTAGPDPRLMQACEEAEVYLATLAEVTGPASEPSRCPRCDGFGRIWNNSDPTSGQWQPCECGDTRGHP